MEGQVSCDFVEVTLNKTSCFWIGMKLPKTHNDFTIICLENNQETYSDTYTSNT